MDWRNEPAPTHRCKMCGALWRFWRKEETQFATGDSWNLRSTACGKCCDMEPMGDQIEPLTLGEMEKYFAARMAVDAMTQHMLGPKDALTNNRHSLFALAGHLEELAIFEPNRRKRPPHRQPVSE